VSPEVTIFSAPKAFRGHVGIIQENAVRSWSRLRPTPTIVLFGADAATGAVEGIDGVRIVTDVATNSHGTPLLPDVFKRAAEMSSGDILAFVNTDILLSQRMLEAIAKTAAWSEQFLLVAQRVDVDVRGRFDFDGEADTRWRDLVATGKLHPAGGIDIFAFRRGQYAEMPPFAIGRTSYDNWLLWKSVSSGIPLVDATDFVKLVHQNHDYGHLPGVDVWNGEEAQQNRRWIAHWSNYYTISHSNWKMRADGEIVRATDWKYRLAGPRRLLSHAIRGARPLRRRLYSWRRARRYGS
jgi:hypothetical protein